ncbi:hypothetical protein [Spiroplasma poulsonii]|nr:hypothetical protein [Spiroplasma poulsonii]
MFNITNKLTLTGNLTILIYTKTAKHPNFMVPMFILVFQLKFENY